MDECDRRCGRGIRGALADHRILSSIELKVVPCPLFAAAVDCLTYETDT